MAQFYANAGGAIIGYAPTFWIALGPAPALTAFTIDFDESQNPGLIADYIANVALYTAPAGVLTKSGVSVVITAASALYALQQTIITGVPKATLEATIVALWNGTATTTQQQKAIAYLAMILHAKEGLI